MTKTQLKRDLTRIHQNQFVIPEDITVFYEQYAKVMLECLGDIDSELRDTLIYEIFDQWIAADRFSFKQLEMFLGIVCDEEHLMYHVGEQNKNSVFTRSFSALMIASILQKENEQHFLSHVTLHQVSNRVIEYYYAEKDLRGFILVGGWAHSAAHGADVFAELAKCEAFGADDLIKMLEVLRFKVCQGGYVFIDREPERICVAVRGILKRNLLNNRDIEQWLAGFQSDTVVYDDIISYHRWINVHNFFKTLYFALRSHEEMQSYLPFIAGMISVL